MRIKAHRKPETLIVHQHSVQGESYCGEEETAEQELWGFGSKVTCKQCLIQLDLYKPSAIERIKERYLN